LRPAFEQKQMPVTNVVISQRPSQQLPVAKEEKKSDLAMLFGDNPFTSDSKPKTAFSTVNDLF
jgi:hypothetical protein